MYLLDNDIAFIKLFDRYVPKCVNLPNRDRTWLNAWWARQSTTFGKFMYLYISSLNTTALTRCPWITGVNTDNCQCGGSAGGQSKMRESPAECVSLPQNAGDLATMILMFLTDYIWWAMITQCAQVFMSGLKEWCRNLMLNSTKRTALDDQIEALTRQILRHVNILIWKFSCFPSSPNDMSLHSYDILKLWVKISCYDSLTLDNN